MAQPRSFESTLHDIVYSIDMGTGLKIIRIALYILLLLMIVMVFTTTQFRGLKTEEAMDYCQLGRNMSLKDGMVTKTVRPLTMWKIQQQNPEENPHIWKHSDLYHAPAYPALLAVFFRLFKLIGVDPFGSLEANRGMNMPAESWIVVPLNHLFTILTGWFVFLIGKRMFSREIAFMSMTIFYFSEIIWIDSISGLNISMAVFFSLASFYTMILAMLNRRDVKSKLRWVVPYLFSIVLAAIAFLTRYITLAVVPGICLYAWLMAGRFRGGTRFVLMFVLLYMMLISPWLIRNYRICGNPMGMVGYSALADSTNFPNNSLDREYHPKISGKTVVNTLREKWILNYSEKYRAAIPSLGGGILMGFFLVSFFHHFARPQVNHLRWAAGISILLMAGLAGFFSESSIRMLHVFWPFAVLYGLAFFYTLIDRLDLDIQLYHVSLKCLFVFLATLPFWFTLMPPHKKFPYPPYHPPIVARVASWINAREVICTDMPWATAWYGDCVSILLPKDLEQYYEINDYKQYISGIYFTPLTKNKPFVKQLLDGPEASWLPVISGRIPSDFPLKNGVSLARQDQLFLSDRIRWTSSPNDPRASVATP